MTVVLVHGYQFDRYCGLSLDNNDFTGLWPFSTYDPEPGWAPMISAIRAALPSANIFVYRYASSYHPRSSAQDLVSRISQLTLPPGGAVLVAHSMGGLVSRYAAKSASPGLVRAIITLGTPHRGTPLADLGAYVLPSFFPSEGFKSLKENALLDLPWPSSVPVYAFGGGLPCNVRPSDKILRPLHHLLCSLRGKDTLSSAIVGDAVVPDTSAEPASGATVFPLPSTPTDHLELPANPQIVAAVVSVLRSLSGSSPTGSANFRLTSGLHSETEDLNAAVVAEFGSGYRLADWTDVRAAAGNATAWADSVGLTDQATALVSSGGLRFDGSRQYFIERFNNHMPYSGFLVYDQIDSSLIVLGSWYGLHMPILAVRAAGTQQGLVAFYPLDGNGADASGNGNNGTVTGAVAATGHTGQASTALSFSGTAHVTVPSNPILKGLTTDITMVFWVRKSTTQIGTGVIPISRRISGDTIHFELYSQAGGFAFQCCSSGGSTTGTFYAPSGTGLNTLNDGQWHRVAVTRRFGSLGFTQLYLDGALIQGSYTSGSATAVAPVVDAPLLIGQQASSAPGQFTGYLDDIYIFNRILTQAEIQAIP